MNARHAWRLVPGPLLLSRILWLAVVVAVVRTSVPVQPLLTGIRTSLLHWDAPHYIDIARAGYPPLLDYHDAFLPGYPLLIRAAALVTRDYVVAAWLVSFVSEAFALWYIARLVMAERDRDAAAFSVWLIALAPAALFFTALYTESTFVAAAAASLYHARRGDAQASAVAGVAACAVRLTGLALLPALLVETVSRTGARPSRALLWPLLLPVPMLLYCAYMQVHAHDALAYFDAQRLPSFNHFVAFPWNGFAATWHAMFSPFGGDNLSIFAREVAFGLLGLVLCLAMWASSRIPPSLSLYTTLAWLLTASLTFWRSEARYDLALFPSVLLVSDLTARIRSARPAMLAASGALMCAGVAIFAQGRWLG